MVVLEISLDSTLTPSIYVTSSAICSTPFSPFVTVFLSPTYRLLVLIVTVSNGISAS